MIRIFVIGLNFWWLSLLACCCFCQFFDGFSFLTFNKSFRFPIFYIFNFLPLSMVLFQISKPQKIFVSDVVTTINTILDTLIVTFSLSPRGFVSWHRFSIFKNSRTFWKLRFFIFSLFRQFENLETDERHQEFSRAPIDFIVSGRWFGECWATCAGYQSTCFTSTT